MAESNQDNSTIIGYYLRSVIRYGNIFLKILLKRLVLPEITVDELLDRINSNKSPLILDIRHIQEFYGTNGHIPNARSISISKIKSNLEALQPFKEKEIATVCPGGGLSLAAADILVKAGFADIKSLHIGVFHEQKYYSPPKLCEFF